MIRTEFRRKEIDDERTRKKYDVYSDSNDEEKRTMCERFGKE
jgi:hypothetical protein